MPPRPTVDDDQQLHFDVAIERNGEQIRGTLADRLGTTLEFTGWLELMSAFDTARARATDRAVQADPPTGRP